MDTAADEVEVFAPRAPESYDGLLAAASRGLSMGLFESALASATRAFECAETPLERAGASVMRIQLLEEVGQSREALDLSTKTTLDADVIALTPELALAAGSLFLHHSQARDAERVLCKWLEARLDGRGPPGARAADSNLVRVYVLRVVLPLYGLDKARDALARAETLVIADDLQAIRDELVAAERRDSVRITAVGPPRSAARDAAAALARRRRDAVAGLEALRVRVLRWGSTQPHVGVAGAAAVLGVITALLIALRRRKSTAPVLRMLRDSAIESLRLAFGGRAGRWVL